MANLAAVGLYMGYVALVGKIFQTGAEMYDEAKSNPKLRVEALKKMSAETDAAHQDSVNKLKKSQQEFEASSRAREEEANKRVQQLKNENNDSIEALKSTIKTQDNKHEENVKKMNEDHQLKLQSMKYETKEAQKKIETEHKNKVDTLEQTYRKESTDVKEKLEKTKSEGNQKIAIAEKEKEELNQMKQNELDEYLKLMTKINETHREQVKKIGEKNRQLKIDNMRQRKEQNEVENRKRLEHVNKSYDQLLHILTMENSQNVLRRFQSLAEQVLPIENSLNNIRNECQSITDGTENIPGYLDADIESVREAMNRFNYGKRTFTQYVTSTNFTDRRLFNACSDAIDDISRLMSTKELSMICNQFLRAIESDTRNVKKYRMITSELHQNFSKLNERTTGRIRTLIRDYIATSETTPAIMN